MRRDTGIFRATIWLALLGYALVASGLPLPLGTTTPANPSSAAGKRLAVKDRSQPFPCMDKSCGCATAEQCFRQCCCNTPAETLAWARAHKIDLAVIAALQQRVAVAAPPTQGSCCSSARSCRSTEPIAATGSGGAELCSEESSAAAATLANAGGEPVVPQRDGQRSVVLRALLACSGIAAQWVSGGASLPPPPAVAVTLATLVIDSIALADDEFSHDRAAPDAPPPRVA